MNTLPNTVLITGAAKRLGREIALQFAKAGWQVAIHYGHSQEQAVQTMHDCEALGVKACIVQADLQDLSNLGNVLQQVKQLLGGVNCVVNNASMFEYDSAQTFDPAILQAHLNPNLAAPICLAKALFELTPVGQVASVINILDQKLAFLNPDFFSYTLTKAALETATVMLAQGLAPRLRVIGVSPGLTLPSYLQDQAAYEQAKTLSLTGQSSRVEDVASMVLFAAQNPSITGCTLRVDGGQPHMGLRRDVSYM